MSEAPPVFPPLFHGMAMHGRADPFAKACAQALLGCDSGLVTHNIGPDLLRAAIVLAPEVPLEQAMAAFIACGVGFQNALGALAPPEVAVHLGWSGEIFVNGARCGRLRAAAATPDRAAQPDWLVIGLSVPLLPPPDTDPGAEPDRTCLFEEGCVDVAPTRLLEAWVRHSLVWLNRMEEDGNRALHAEWRGLARGIGEPVAPDPAGRHGGGTFLGTDEAFGMLLRTGSDTVVIPLSTILQAEAPA